MSGLVLAPSSAGQLSPVAQGTETGTGTAPRTARVGVLGATGYAGREFVRLAATHPGLAVCAVGMRDGATRAWSDLFPGWDPSGARPVVASMEDVLAEAARGGLEALVSALPHGMLAGLLGERADLLAGENIWLDLSGDHRAGERGFLYGLPEAFRADLLGARRIANPGCYPTAAALALLPAAQAAWLAGPVTVTALSGVSGAGRAAELRTAFVEVNEGASFYRAGGEHTHGPEMATTLSRLAGRPVGVGFVPQLVPMSRGILLTAVAPLMTPRTLEDARALYEAAYAAEPFVRLLPPGEWPATRAVRGSNRCDLALAMPHDGRTLVAMAAIDNLVKGAAGQAVQNLNLALGWPEATGLPAEGMPW